MGFARNIEALILKFDITQNGLADTVKVSPATVSRWVNGSMGVRPTHVRRICEAFELKPDDLLSDDHGLAAQMDGTDKENPAAPARGDGATLPFLSGSQAAARAYEGAAFASPLRVEVPFSIASEHPGAFVVAVGDDAADLVVAQGSHAVVDPATRPGNGSLVAVVLPAGDAAGATVTLRRWHRGNQTAVLSTESNRDRDDIVLRDGCPEGGDSPARLLGTVVWYQAPGQLG